VDLRDLVVTKDHKVTRHKVTKGLKGRQSKDLKVPLDLHHKVMLDRQDLQGLKDPPVQLVILHKDLEVLLETPQKVLLADKDPLTQGLQDQQVTKVQLVQKVLKDRPHLKVLRVIKDLQHRREHLVPQDLRVTKDQEDLKGDQVIRDLWVPRDQ
jgi:hypothetical protein